MSKLVFDYNWEGFGELKADELACTYARFEIVFENEIITQVIDRKSDSIKDYVNISLYPLAEWILTNWWYIFFEPYTPRKISLVDYHSKHCISYAREGYALPNLSFKPIGLDIFLHWKSVGLKYHKIDFLNSGEGIIPSEQLKETLFDFISKVIARLESFEIYDTFLQKEWSHFLKLDDEEIEFCKVSANLGLDPYGLSEKQSKSIIEVCQKLPKNVLEDFLYSCYPKNVQQDADLVMAIFKNIDGNTSDIGNLRNTREILQKRKNTNLSPWNEGYQAASALRLVLNIKGKLLRDLVDIEKALNLSHIEIKDLISYEDKIPDTISSVCGTNKAKSPVFILSKYRNDQTTKFAFCRGLYDYFFSDDNSAYLVTSSYVERQKRNRAFAAELLVPSDILRKKVDKFVTQEDISQLADEFKVDSRIIEHQLNNHKIAEIEDQDFYN